MKTTEPTKTEIRIGLAFTFTLLFGVVLLKAASFEEAQHYDFSNFYAAGWIIRHGDGSKLYNLQEQIKVEESLFKGRGFLVEIHPPFEELLYVPLSMLSYQHAYMAWGAINIFLWMLFAHIARPCAPVPKQTFRYLALCFAFFPAWIALHLGQPTILLLLSYCLTFLSLKSRRDSRAGFFLGLGLFKYQLVLPFALIFALRRKWRFVAGFCAAALMLGVLSLAAVGLAGVLAYVKLLAFYVKDPTNPLFSATTSPWNMPNLRGFFAVLTAGRFAPRWTYAVVAFVSAFLIWTTARQWRHEDRTGTEASLPLMFAAGLTVSLLTGFHLHIADLCPFLLAVLLVLGSPQWKENPRWRLVLVACMVTLYIPFVYLLMIDWDKVYLLFPVLLLFTLGIFGLLGKSGRTNRDERGAA